MYRLIDNEQLSNFGNEDAYSFIGRRIFLLFPQCYWIITSLFHLKQVNNKVNYSTMYSKNIVYSSVTSCLLSKTIYLINWNSLVFWQLVTRTTQSRSQGQWKWKWKLLKLFKMLKIWCFQIKTRCLEKEHCSDTKRDHELLK